MPIYIPLPDDQSSIKLADWLEINTLIDPDGSSSAQDLKYPLSSLSDEEESSVVSGDVEDKVAEVFSEIEKRTNAAKKNYPFKVDDDKLVKKSNHTDCLPYIFCLLISYFGVEKDEYVSEWKTHNIAKKFEHLSANAIKNLLYNDRCGLEVRVFGFPRKYNTPQDTRFVVSLKKLCDECGEMKPNPSTSAQRMQDAGLDIIAWKKFPDNLAGNIFFWGQCASGNNWRDKLRGVESFGYFVANPTQYIRGTFIPHTVEITSEDPDCWNVITYDAGMIIDRCRIAYLSELNNTKMKSEFSKFIRKALTSIRKQRENADWYN